MRIRSRTPVNVEYRKLQRLNNHRLLQKLRQLDLEHASINSDRVNRPEFEAWYARTRRHASDEIEFFYLDILTVKLRSIEDVLSTLNTLAPKFDGFEIEHLREHVLAKLVRVRRVDSGKLRSDATL